MKIKFVLILTVFFFNLNAFCQNDNLQDDKFLPYLDEALKCLKTARKDITIPVKFMDKDESRLKIVEHLMESPLEIHGFLQKTSADLHKQENSLAETLITAGKNIDITSSGIKLNKLPVKKPLVKSILKIYEICGQELTQNELQNIQDKISQLPDELADTIGVIVESLCEAKLMLNWAFSDVTKDEYSVLQEKLPLLLLDSDNNLTEKDTKKVLEIAGKVKREYLLTASLYIARSCGAAYPVLKKIGQNSIQAQNLSKPDQKCKSAVGDILFYCDTPLGEIVIGGTSETTYTGRNLLTIDLGGNDAYMSGCGGAYGSENPLSVLIDVLGDDVYKTKEDFAFGSGFLGIGFLLDLAGNDQYFANNFSLGSGLLGIGYIKDESGDDTYSGDTFAEGAGAFGIGILRDLTGNDQYFASYISQGFGFVQGLGALIEGNGNDSYYSGGGYLNPLAITLPGHYFTLSQGFGFGIRNIASGGIGLLLDKSGDDIYESDVYGQGASYWFSLGGLVDESGNDSYFSFQYAQGSGIHYSIAGLIDKSGDDYYVSHGVSQGSGHDMAYGILIDYGGNDSYKAESLSQGASNAMAFGFFIDVSGNDIYEIESPKIPRGFGDTRDDYPCISVFLDTAGNDIYIGPGKNNGFIINYTFGIIMDIDK